MNDLNTVAIIGLLIRMASIGVVLFYVIPKQFLEVLRPRDWLTDLRWYILVLFLFSIFAAIPSLSYQLLRSNGGDSSGLRSVATITGNLSNLASSVLLVLIYNYKKKDK